MVFVMVLGPLAIGAYACEDEPAPPPHTEQNTTTPPPASTPPADTPPAETPPADTPPANTPPADTPTDPGTGTGSGSGTGTGGTGASSGTGSNPSAGGGTGSPAGSGSGSGTGTGTGTGTGSGTGTGGETGSGTTTTPTSTDTSGTVKAESTPNPSGGVENDAKDPEDSSSRGTLKVEKPVAKSAGANTTVKVATPIPAAVVSASETKKPASKGSSEGKSNSDSDGGTDRLRERTTIARAVDGIPLVFRIALLALLFTTSVLAVISWRERRRATAVARVALLDHLTGLSNREGFDRQMAIEWQRALRHGRPLGLVFVDLDHFKAFNDTNGHVAGDRLLREVAAAITATARGSDFTARLGGDEFVVLCPEADQAGLDRLVERLRVEAAGMAVSLSIGSAGKLESDSGPDDLVHRADAAMYEAKGGRRRGSKSGNPMLGSMRTG
jgi:diguanylate cyclase (GGDEF)-like protein